MTDLLLRKILPLQIVGFDKDKRVLGSAALGLHEWLTQQSLSGLWACF